MNKPSIIGFLQSNKLIRLNGTSVGEAPHVIFKVIFPVAREIYVSDTIDNISDSLMEALFINGYIKNKWDYEIYEDDNNVISVTRKGEAYA